MVSLKKIRTLILLLSILTVDLLAIVAPTNFHATEVTDSTISFSWKDNSSDEDGYRVCKQLRLGGYDCSNLLLENTQSYTKTDILEDTNASYCVFVDKDGESSLQSDSISVKTTHTWGGELLKCVNEDLGHGENNTTHTPTKAELESLIGAFYCINKVATGSIDPVTDLKNITELYLYSNQLSGPIPAEIGSLSSLTYLNLNDNNLTGPIPAEIGSLSSLTYLNLSSNELSESIPAEIGNLSSLTRLTLSSNQLSGSIPVEIGYLTNLTGLYLSSNQLSGPIPAEIGALTNLTSLYLPLNQLSGHIPTEIRNLTNLTHLSLAFNQLSGSIPVEMGNLSSLTNLYLPGNQLSGHIPAEIGNLTNLVYLSLDSNQLSGPIPTEIGNLTNLGVLYLNNNKLSGIIPVSIKNLSSLNNQGARLIINCNLHTDNVSVQQYIDAHSPPNCHYQDILDTNSHDCSVMAPIIMYLLN